MSGDTDTVFRAMTDDGTFRVVTANTTETVRGAIAAQGVTGDLARHFGDLVTGVVLTRLTMSPALRVQGILSGRENQGTLVADSHPSGRTRGLASGKDSLAVGQGSLLRMMRTLHDGRLHQGVVEMPAGGISEALMAYMQVSEQVTTMVAVGTILGSGGVQAAGGYLVQLLPGAQRGPLMVMTERLEEFKTIDDRLAVSGFTPAALMADLLHGMPYTPLGESEVRFECWCSRLGVVSALATLPRTEVESLTQAGEILEIRCDYCTKEYQIAPAELRGLLDPS